MDFIFQIEAKGKDLRLVDKVDALINRYDCDLFSVYSFEKKLVNAFVSKHSKYPIHWNIEKFSHRNLEEGKTLGIGINLDGRFVRQSDIEKLKAAGICVHVYTVNDADHANELFDYGVDAIITDTLIKGEGVG